MVDQRELADVIESRILSRREFLTRVAMLGLLTSTGSFVLDDLPRAIAATPGGAIAPTTIIEAGRRLRDGSLSSEALTKAYLQCIKQLEPQLNAFITLMEEQALETATARDAELRAGEDRGPLHGIPIVHKDIYDTAGVLTTVGSEFFEGRVPEEDATVVGRLNEAGVVVLGKTNMNEFAAGVSGTNAFYGDTHNPWDLSRSPGGSSSGTGTAIAAGLCLRGTGTDTGGSVRVPASWCGITGIRPTYGLVSLAGVYPRAYSLDTAGPLAHSVADVAVLLDHMAGYDLKDPNSSRNQIAGGYTDNLEEGVRGLRLGIVKDYTFRDVDPEVASAVQAAADTLAGLGAEIETIEIPVLVELDYAELFNNVLLYEFNQILGEQYRATEDKSVFGPTVQENIEKGSQISRETYEDALEERPRQIEQAQEAFEKVDALLTPTLPMVAPPLTAGTDVYNRGRQFTLPFSFLELPCISVPGGLSSGGLPIGLLIVGNRFEEALILRIAAAFEAATGFHKQHPPIYCDFEGTLPYSGGPTGLPSTGGPATPSWSSLLKAIEAIFKR